MIRYARWKAWYWGNGSLHWLTVTSAVGTEEGARIAAKEKMPYWTLKEVRPCHKSVLTDAATTDSSANMIDDQEDEHDRYVDEDIARFAPNGPEGS